MVTRERYAQGMTYEEFKAQLSRGPAPYERSDEQLDQSKPDLSAFRDQPKYDVVELLVKKGADVNARDDIWYQTPLSSAVSGLQPKSVKFLIDSGAKDVDSALVTAAGMGCMAALEAERYLAKVEALANAAE